MNLKPIDVVIHEGNPFLNCKLDREKHAHVLTRIVERYKNGFVLSVNSGWGSGKTTFIKMWQQDLEQREYSTVYYNAWENDHGNEPILSILAEIKESLAIKIWWQDDKWQNIVKSIAPIAIKIGRKLLGSLTKRMTGFDTDEFSKAIEDTEGVTNKLIEDYLERKKSITNFKTVLAEYISIYLDKPLIILVDELDRCRPDYAISTLEAIKHLFNVNNIVFVLSIDKKHLEASIKGYYGSDSIDSIEYLKRFINFEYQLPQPPIERFIMYYWELKNFSDFAKNPDYVKEYLIYISTISIGLRGPSIRTLVEVLSRIELCLITINNISGLKDYTFFNVITLCYIMHYSNEEERAPLFKDYSSFEELEFQFKSFWRIIFDSDAMDMAILYYAFCLKLNKRTMKNDSSLIESSLIYIYHNRKESTSSVHVDLRRDIEMGNGKTHGLFSLWRCVMYLEILE